MGFPLAFWRPHIINRRQVYRDRTIFACSSLQCDRGSATTRGHRKIRDKRLVRNKAVTSRWPFEGAKFSLKLMNEVKTCSLTDILVAVVDGLKRVSRGA